MALFPCYPAGFDSSNMLHLQASIQAKPGYSVECQAAASILNFNCALQSVTVLGQKYGNFVNMRQDTNQWGTFT